jgi:hypothetical protein
MKKILMAGCVFLLAFQVKAQTEISLPGQELETRIQVDIYPNPTVDFLNIQVSETQAEITFHLHNIIGNEIKIKPEKVGDNKYRINVESLAPGYYLLAVKESTSKFTKTLKFLKR